MHNLFQNAYLCSAKRQRFSSLIRQAMKMSAHDLLCSVKSKNLDALQRSAVLRVLVASAPIEVTQGRTFLTRRRLVRQHYQV